LLENVINMKRPHVTCSHMQC